MYENEYGIKTIDETKKKEEKPTYKPPKQVNMLGGGAQKVYVNKKGGSKSLL